MTHGTFSDLQDLEPVSVSRTETRYLCPYCEDNKGTPDTQGKLYINWDKRVGFCHRCETRLKDDGYVDLEITKSRLKAGRPRKKRKFTLDGWTTAVSENPAVQAYALRRNLTSTVCIKFGLRACTTPFKGLVIPNELSDNLITDFFQVRNISPTATLKYLNLPDVDKPLYGTSRISDKKVVVVNEGTLSAIAQSRLSDIGVLALYGKYISDDQLKELKKLKPDRVYVALDGGFMKSIDKCAKRIVDHIGCEVYCILYPWMKDPDDLTVEELTACFQRAVRYMPSWYWTMLKVASIPRDQSIKEKDWEAIREKSSGETLG